MKIYLAASYDSKEAMRRYRQIMQEEFGITVTSRWLDSEDPEAVFGTQQASRKGVEDLADILVSDLVVVYTRQPSTTGGRHVELGFAIGSGKPIVIVGPRENIFQSIDGILQFGTWEGFFNYIRKVMADYARQARPAARP